MRNKLLILLISIFLIFTLISCHNPPTSINNDNLQIHFIDVGQGDAVLLTTKDKNLLIDSGPKEARKDLISYLKDRNINTLDYIILTHPHEDHMGGMAKVISTFNIGKIYSPKITSNSKNYEDFINAIKEKNLKINVIKSGESSINLKDNISITFFSPIENYDNTPLDNINNYSPIIKIAYLNNSIILTGDAEKEIEQKAIEENFPLKADILKVGHHGSSTSTTEDFLSKVNPKIAVISVGKYNKYGHPNKETLDKLKKKDALIYRTDLEGTIILELDGNSIYKKTETSR